MSKKKQFHKVPIQRAMKQKTPGPTGMSRARGGKGRSEESRLDTCTWCGYSGGRHSELCDRPLK